MERPSYIGATSAFRAAQARMVGVKLEDDGLDLDDLRGAPSRGGGGGPPREVPLRDPQLPEPVGDQPLPGLAAARLLEAARELDLLIVEDDPYGDLYFEAEPLPHPPRRWTGRARVVYLSSFSKILAPGLRTAFMLGPEELLAKVEIAKQSANLCGSSLDQRIILACLRRGLIEEQKARIRPYYRAKRDAMLDALAGRDAARRRAGRAPQGGLFVWLTLPEGAGRRGAAASAAVAEGVAYVTGRAVLRGRRRREHHAPHLRQERPTIQEGVGGWVGWRARMGSSRRTGQRNARVVTFTCTRTSRNVTSPSRPRDAVVHIRYSIQ